MFASAVLPSDCPKYWEIVSTFASSGEKQAQSSLTPIKAKIFIENLTFLESGVLVFDDQLALELQSFASHLGKSLGIVLISYKKKCKVCESELLVKADRPSKVVVYTDRFGTVYGTQYRKICKRFRFGCSFVQYYGYYTNGGDTIAYDDDYKSLPYFVSTRETAFETSMLEQFDVEILVGQLSYMQRSDIYNIKRGYMIKQKRKSMQQNNQGKSLYM